MSERPERHIVLTWEDIDKLVDTLLPQLRAVGPFDGMIMIMPSNGPTARSCGSRVSTSLSISSHVSTM